jgi:CheY-like chemotaxis protein
MTSLESSITEDSALTRQITDIGVGVLFFLLLGVLLLALSQGWNWQLPVLIALGVFLAGALIGFLFGIPKVASAAAKQQNQSTNGQASDAPRILNVNTNLEDISDWLTKIIVGLGLVELRNIPAGVLRFANVTGPAFHSSGSVAPVAVAIYFPVLGFTSGYLLTRLYLSTLIGRADVQLTRFRQTQSDVERLVAAASRASSDKAEEGVTPDEKAAAAANVVRRAVTPQTLWNFRSGSILWVDDNPSNNMNLIDAFRKLGINVDLSLSTDEALAKLDGGQRYDAIITDMGRPPDGKAGYTLLAALRDRGIRIPTLVYAGSSAPEHRKEAQAAGAVDSTGSSNRVFEFVTNVIAGKAHQK